MFFYHYLSSYPYLNCVLFRVPLASLVALFPLLSYIERLGNLINVKYGNFCNYTIGITRYIFLSCLQAGLGCFVHVFCLGGMSKAWETMIWNGPGHVFVMLYLLKVALPWRQQLQRSIALIQTRLFSFVRDYCLPGGCVAFTLDSSANLCRRSII